MELLLTCSVPNLNANHFIVYENVFGQEVDAHSGFLLSVVGVLGKPENDGGFAHRLIT